MTDAAALGIAAFSASLLLTRLFCGYALRRGLIDHPTERGSHTVPTPRGAGVAIAIVVLGFGVAGLTQGLPLRETAGWLIGGALVALVGFWDDHGHVSASARAGAHVAAGILGAIALTGQIPVGLVGIAAGGGLVLTLAWSVNLYNFMDGSDGLAALQAVMGASFLTLILFLEGHHVLGLAALILACATAGFLPWNLPSARVFMGDGGSGFLGYALAALIITASYGTDLGIATLVLPFGYFAFDASVTLLRRGIRGERIHEAHRKHAYQRALRSGLGHKGVLLGSFVVQALLIVLAGSAYMQAISSATAIVAGLLLLSIVYGLVELRAPMETA